MPVKDRKLDAAAAKALTKIGESRPLSRLFSIGLIAAAAFGAGALLGRTRQEKPAEQGLAPASDAPSVNVSLDKLRNAGF